MNAPDLPEMPEGGRGRGGLANDVCRRIADEIVLGQLTPGMRLDEVSLAARFNVSRTPIRDALRRLVDKLFAVRNDHCPAEPSIAQFVGENREERLGFAHAHRHHDELGPDTVRPRFAGRFVRFDLIRAQSDHDTLHEVGQFPRSQIRERVLQWG